MTVYNAAFINTQLSKQTSIFGLRLWVLIGILIGSIIVLTLFLLSLCLTARRRKNHHKTTKLNHHSPIISKEIQEITHAPPSSEIHVVDISYRRSEDLRTVDIDARVAYFNSKATWDLDARVGQDGVVDVISMGEG
jgi:hypothetical protein